MTFSLNSQAFIVNKYTGRKSGPFIVLAITPTGKTVTIARPDFATKTEQFKTCAFYDGKYFNDYSGFLVNA